MAFKLSLVSQCGGGSFGPNWPQNALKFGPKFTP